MSIIKGTNQIVAGFGGTKRSIGEVYFSQSSLATDNSGALPLFTGETIASANTIYPDFYNWVLAHTELQCTSEEYEGALNTYGECPKYVIKFPVTNTVYKYNLTGLSNALESRFSFYIKNENDEYVTIEDKVYYYTNEEFIIEPLKSNEPTIFLDEKCTQKIYTEYHPTGGEQAYYEVKLTLCGPSKVRLKIDISDVAGVFIAPSTGSVTPSTIKNTETILTVTTYVSNGSLRLPLLKNYIKAANPSEGIKNIEAGLPNHTHNIVGSANYNGTINNAFGNGTSNPATLTNLISPASESNPIYGKSDTVTPASTTLYPWVVAYAASIPASEAQAAQFQQGLSGKADTNLGNITSLGKKSSVSWIMPDYSRVVATGLAGNPTSQSTNSYTCPTDGWINMHADRSVSGNTLLFRVNEVTRASFQAFSATFANLMYLVNKGDIVNFRTDSTSNTWVINYCNFIPCKGA